MAFVKRASEVTKGWDDVIKSGEIRPLLEEVVEIRKSHPVRGRWIATGDRSRVWVDASSTALGVDGASLEMLAG